MQDARSHQLAEEDSALITDHLNRILESRHFRSSRKYQAFLQYVVTAKLSKEASLLKERTLGIEIFRRQADYDTGADPVVRVTAGEVRKRLAQYYQDAPAGEAVRIHLPIGTYVPQFTVVQVTEEVNPVLESPIPIGETDSVAEEEESTISLKSDTPASQSSEQEVTRSVSWGTHAIYAMLLLLCLIAVFVLAFKPSKALSEQSRVPTTLDILWLPLLNDPSRLTLYLEAIDVPAPQNAVNNHAYNEQLVPSSTSFAGMAVFSYLHWTKHDFMVRQGKRVNFSDFQNGPSAILGLSDDFWVQTYMKDLPIHFTTNANGTILIQDASNPNRPTTVATARSDDSGFSSDYAIVSRVYDTNSKKWVLIASGVGSAGMYAAGRFLRNPQYSEALLEQARNKWTSGVNVEIVLSTKVIHGISGPPEIVLERVW